MVEQTQAPKRNYEIITEGSEEILRLNYEAVPFSPSVEDSAECMVDAIEKLSENPSVSKMTFSQRRNYTYDFDQTQMLVEIAQIYGQLAKRKRAISMEAMGTGAEPEEVLARRYEQVNNVVFNLLKSDPLGAYVELKRKIRTEHALQKQARGQQLIDSSNTYLSVLAEISSLLEGTKLVSAAKPYLAGYQLGDRSVYKAIFKPAISPNFMYSRLIMSPPMGGKQLAMYNVDGNTEVAIYSVPGDVKYMYHITPPEFKLTEDKYALVDLARSVLAEHKPREEEFLDPQKLRVTFMNIGSDLLRELAEHQGLDLTNEEIKELSEILVRNTIGFGIVELLLKDDNVQDININSPMGQVPIFLLHSEFNECFTNVTPTTSDFESWGSKFRLLSGRPLDEANPILDTELSIPGARARVSIINKPLNPYGLAFAYRRHRDKPWTLPLFIKTRMLNPMAAGLISFLIQGSRTMLVAGTRSSGKTSLLGSCLVEIMRKYRILSVEDTMELPTDALRGLGYNIQPMKVRSALTKGGTELEASEGIRTALRLGDSALIVGEVRSSLRGDEEVVIVENGVTKRVAIKDVENLDQKSVYLPTLTADNKMELKKLSGFVKHPKRKQLVKITTKTGRSVVVTPDHSVFTHVDFRIAAINTDKLKQGDPIIIPSKLPNSFNDIDYVNLLEIFKDDYRLEGAEPYIRKAIKVLTWKKASKLASVCDIYRYLLSTQKTRIPIISFLKLMKASKVKYNLEELRIKRGTSNSIPAKFPINENTLRLIGYYLSEGNLGKNGIQITNSKPEIIADVMDICHREFGINVYKRVTKGLGTSVQMLIQSKPLSDLLVYLGCGRTSFHKRIPEFVYGLSESKICALLRGIYSGDGSFSSTKSAGNMVRYYSTAKKLVEDVSYALLSIGIVCRLIKRPPAKLSKKDCFIAEIKQRRYVEKFLGAVGFTHKKPEMILKAFPHSTDDSVYFDPKELEKHLKLPRKYRHLRRTKCCSKDYLKRVTEDVKCSDEIYSFAHGDFFIDKVKSLEVINLPKEEYVYDLSVASTQRFIGGFAGILLHNTEAIALYEAMRVGALANVVAGTIHGDSPYGVFDRVVNDLGVPRTSFKATDIIIVANPLKSPDGMHKWRRVTQITEVRKTWEEDPLEERGFVDLMKYNAKTDELEPTPDLINGDSEVLKSIGANVKEWTGNWDAIWENIMLRAKSKEAIVRYSDETKDPELLEAPFVIRSNDQMQRISEEVRDEVGELDNKMVYERWESWLKKVIRDKNY